MSYLPWGSPRLGSVLTAGNGVDGVSSSGAGATSIFDSGFFTVAGWARVLADRGLSTYQELFQLGSSASYIGLYWETAEGVMGAEGFDADHGVGITAATFSARPSTGVWFYWAMSVDHTVSSGINAWWWSREDGWKTAQGSFASTTFTFATNGPSSSVAFGWGEAGQDFNGNRGPVKAWNRPMDFSEIQRESFQVAPVSRDALVGFWPMSPTIGLAKKDIYLNHDLVLAGSPTIGDAPPVKWLAPGRMVESFSEFVRWTFNRYRFLRVRNK